MSTHPAVAKHNEGAPMGDPIPGEDNPRLWEGLRVSFLTGTTKDGSITRRTGEILWVEFEIHGGVYFTSYVIREEATGVKYAIGSGRVRIAADHEGSDDVPVGALVSYLDEASRGHGLASHTGRVVGVIEEHRGGLCFRSYRIKPDGWDYPVTIHASRVRAIDVTPAHLCTQCEISPVGDDCGMDSICGACHEANAIAAECEEQEYGCYVSYNGYDRSEETVCERPPLARGVCESCEHAEHTYRWRKFVYAMGHDADAFSEV